MNTEDNNSSKFDEVYEKYKGMVFQTALTCCYNNYHTAQEIFQEAFIKCYVNRIYLKDDKYVLTWLKRVVQNSAIDYWRKRQKEVLAFDVDVSKGKETYASMDEWYIKDLEKKRREELTDSILEGLRNKNSRWYDCVIMFYVLEMKEKDIAENMGVSVDAVKSIMKRARSWVKKHYQIDMDA